MEMKCMCMYKLSMYIRTVYTSIFVQPHQVSDYPGVGHLQYSNQQGYQLPAMSRSLLVWAMRTSVVPPQDHKLTSTKICDNKIKSSWKHIEATK